MPLVLIERARPWAQARRWQAAPAGNDFKGKQGRRGWICAIALLQRLLEKGRAGRVGLCGCRQPSEREEGVRTLGGLKKAIMKKSVMTSSKSWTRAIVGRRISSRIAGRDKSYKPASDRRRTVFFKLWESRPSTVLAPIFATLETLSGSEVVEEMWRRAVSLSLNRQKRSFRRRRP